MSTLSTGAGRPILVTGLHRTGTTWTGKLLASAPELFYIDEPFHVRHPPGIFPVQVNHWFQHVGPQNEEIFGPGLACTVNLQFSLWHHITNVLGSGPPHKQSGLRGVKWGLRKWYRWTQARFQGARPLIKDPLALLAAEWIAGRFDAQVIILVRHPAGFVRSIRELEWRHDFSDFTEQAGLFEGLLEPYANDIKEEAENPSSLLENATLLWKVMGAVIAKYRQRHPNWQIVRMEDLAMSPIERFQELWSYLGVSVNDQMRDAVHEYTRARSPDSEDVGPYTVKRDSRRQAWKWKDQLDRGTVQRIREETAPIWRHFYHEDEWN